MISETIPENFDRQMKLYTANPEAYGKIVDAETLAAMQVHHAGIEALGFIGYTKAMSKVHMLSKKDKAENTSIYADAAKDYDLSSTEAKVVELYGTKYLGTGLTVKQAANRGIKDYLATQQRFGDDLQHRLSNTSLTPFGDKKEVPIILNALKTKIAEWQADKPNAIFTVSDDSFGNIFIEEATTSTVVKTKAEIIWKNYLARHAKNKASSKEALEALIEKQLKEDERKKKMPISPYDYSSYVINDN